MVLCFQGFALSTGLSKPLHWLLLCLPHDICCIFSSVAWHIITSPHKCVDLLNDHQTVAFETCNVLPCTTPVAMLFGHLIFRGQCINVQDPYRPCKTRIDPSIHGTRTSAQCVCYFCHFSRPVIET